MTWPFAILLALAPPQAPAQDIDAVQAPKVAAAFGAIKAGHPQEALDSLDGVLATYDAAHAGETRQIYCGMSTTEALLYMGLAAKTRTGAIAVGPNYCTAMFLKGYALVDLNRLADARAVYERLITLAPMHAHFLAELGQTYRYEHNWPKMLETCTTAEGYAEFANPADVNTAKRMGWRCMGYALTEQHKYDEAAELYRKCLKLEPKDTIAAHELKYIDEQRAK
jgi:tetratricopeptide (TPR) repeat protein